MFMKDTLNYVLGEVPKFLLNYIHIFGSPKDYVLKITTNGLEEDQLRKALVYFALCYLVAIFFTIPLFGAENYKGIAMTGSFIFEGIILLLMSSVALTLAWRLVRCKLSFPTYFIVYSYQIGTILPFYLFLNILNISILKYNDPSAYNKLMDYTYRGIGNINPYENFGGGMLMYNLMNFSSLVFVIFWFYKSWDVYRIKHRASRKISVISGFLFVLLMVIVLFVYIQISKHFDSEAFNKINYGL
jgi:hypothetical protein